MKEFTENDLSLVTLAPQIFSGSRFNPTRHSAPYTAISQYARGKLFVIAIPNSGGWFYRIDYPYYSWAETIVRPHVQRRDFIEVLRRLSESERNPGNWKLDSREMTSAVKFLDESGSLATSSQSPDEVASIVASGSLQRAHA